MRKGFGSEVEKNSGLPISMNAGGIPKLRARAAAGLGEHQAEQLVVQRMRRTVSLDAEPPRHVVVIGDVTRGLGLDVEVERRIQNLVQGTNVEFTPKTQTQRISLAKSKLIETLRANKALDGDVRLEITKRAMSWWRKSVDTELVRSRIVNPIVWPKDMAKSKRPKLLIKAARGGSYYRRVPTGNPECPYRYYYTREEYERAHGDAAHIVGSDALALTREARDLVHAKRVEKSVRMVYTTPRSRRKSLEDPK